MGAQTLGAFNEVVLAIIAAARICAAVPARAEDVGVGVGVGQVGAGMTVGSDHRDRDQATVIKQCEREPDIPFRVFG